MRACQYLGFWVDRIGSAFPIYCPNKRQRRETEGMNRARKEEEEEIRMYDSLIYVMEKESKAGREERRHDPLSSRHHFICRSPLQLGFF